MIKAAMLAGARGPSSRTGTVSARVASSTRLPSRTCSWSLQTDGRVDGAAATPLSPAASGSDRGSADAPASASLWDVSEDMGGWSSAPPAASCEAGAAAPPSGDAPASETESEAARATTPAPDGRSSERASAGSSPAPEADAVSESVFNEEDGPVVPACALATLNCVLRPASRCESPRRRRTTPTSFSRSASRNVGKLLPRLQL